MLSDKGADKYAVQRLTQDIESLGYKRIKLKSDQENSIRVLKKEVDKSAGAEIVMQLRSFRVR